MASKRAVTAALYRLLPTGALPPDPAAVEALRQPHAADASAEDMAALLQDCIDGPASPEEDEVISECIRRLREAGDGGERDLDKSLAPGVSIVPLPTDATGFAPWSREGEARGTRLVFIGQDLDEAALRKGLENVAA